MLGYVIHNSSKRVAFRTERLGCQRWHTTECLLEAWRWGNAPNAETRQGRPKNDSRSISYERNAMKLSLAVACAQCSVAA